MKHLASSRPDGSRETGSTESATVEVNEPRRTALLKLGLTAGAIYATPTVLRIDRAAAMRPSCPDGDEDDEGCGGYGGGRSRPSGPSLPSGPPGGDESG